MRKIAVFVAVSFTFCLLWAQQAQRHVISAKETLYSISKKYNVSIEDIKKANTFLLTRGLQMGDMLVIPSVKHKNLEKTVAPLTPNINTKTDTQDDFYIYHVVAAKETLYSISRRYNVPVNKIDAINDNPLENGLKEGQTLKIPKDGISPPTDSTKIYKVRSNKETLESISKEHNLPMQALRRANANLEDGALKKGSLLHIPVLSLESKNFIKHNVLPGETLYGLSVRYALSADYILDANRHLKTNGFRYGAPINIPIYEQNIALESKSQTKKEPEKIKFRNTDKIIKLVYILPLNQENEKAKIAERNIAMDFYIGSKYALDSLAKQGISLQIKVLDVWDEAKTSVDKYVSDNHLADMNAIIGPFYKSKVEALSVALSKKNVPVFSPMSTSHDLSVKPNLIQISPTPDIMAEKIIENIVSNPNNKQVQIFTSLKERGLAEGIKNRLDLLMPSATVHIVENADRIDLQTDQHLSVILATKESRPINEVLSLIKNASNPLITTYGVGYNKAYDKIDLLKKIGFSFTQEARLNEKGAKERVFLNKFYRNLCQKPNKNHLLGFDLTYDLIERLNFGENNLARLLSGANVRLARRFEYKQSEKGGFYNVGVRYIRIARSKKIESIED